MQRALFASLFAIASLIAASPSIAADRPDALPGRSRLPTGAFLDPAGPVTPVGSFPVAMVLSPEGDQVVVLLSGWREQGLQVVDRASGAVRQTIKVPSAFLGLTFSPDGTAIYLSGGNDDVIHVYDWRERRAVDAGVITLRVKSDPKQSGASYPAGLAWSADGRQLLVAENLGDSLAVVDRASRAVTQRIPTGRYPYGVVSGAQGEIYLSCWAGAVELFRQEGGAWKRTATFDGGRHPSAMLLNRAGTRLYVASATTDSIAVLDAQTGRRLATLRDAVAGAPSEGSTPNAMVLSADERRLFVAEADSNAVAVFDLDQNSLAGRIPAGWYPSALLRAGGDLLVLNAKGNGSAPNPGMNHPNRKRPPGSTQFTLGQLTGSLMTVPAAIDRVTLKGWSERVSRANSWHRGAATVAYPPFRHVVYIIKENRTYDQVFGDIAEADGDPSLLYFGEKSAPNHHALARRFGVFDRFFTNAEVSAQGHNWSTAAYASDYVEKTTPSNYGGLGRTYDFEGTNRDRLVDDDDDVNAPSTGYLWDLVARKGLSYRNYGEFVIREGEELVPTKAALKAHSNLQYAPFDLDVTDQSRVDVWLRDLEWFAASGTMPAFQLIRLPNDHTSGIAAGKRTPHAYMADNDLALGRIIAALSRTRTWKETVVFVLEDDAQGGPDHVDSHRSVLMVISAWNRSGVIHRFVNTTDVLATIEEILGLRALSHFDYFGRSLRGTFASTPDLRPYDLIVPDVDLNERNPTGALSRASEALDLRDADRADDDLFNHILWEAIKGDAPYPGVTRAPNAGQ